MTLPVDFSVETVENDFEVTPIYDQAEVMKHALALARALRNSPCTCIDQTLAWPGIHRAAKSPYQCPAHRALEQFDAFLAKGAVTEPATVPA